MDWSSMWSAALMAAGGVIVGALGWLGTRASASSKLDEAEITTRGEEWQRIVSEVKSWAEARIAEQDEKIGSLEGTVGMLRLEVESARTKYWKAIYYGRAWRLRHPESVPYVEVPPEIADDL